MKKVEAYIKASRLNEVIESLHEIEGLTGVSAHLHDIRGFGRSRDKDAPVHITDHPPDSVSHVKIELFCRDELLDQSVAAIREAAHTGLRGDGKIYISSIEDAMRISTGARGEEAV